MLPTELYRDQARRWPATGRHVLAHFDDDTVVVYQAYRPAIGLYAAEHGHFGGEFSFARMSWVKPNFLWMMFRSGWGTKPNQEVTLALRVRRAFFDSLLAASVPSSWQPARYLAEADWKRDLSRSDVRLQWDPDHHASGAKLERRAVQLGLRGETLKRFATTELVEVLDLSFFVAEQRAKLASGGPGAIETPREHVYWPADEAVATRIGLDRMAGADF